MYQNASIPVNAATKAKIHVKPIRDAIWKKEWEKGKKRMNYSNI